MNQFKPGDLVYHKATLKRCVVLNVDDNLVKVRDSDNEEHDYLPIELNPEENLVGVINQEDSFY